MAMADKVAVMLAGKIAQFGTPRELYETPVSKDVAAFVGTHPINFTAQPRPKRLPAGFRLPAGIAPRGTKVVIGIRAEHLTPSADGGVMGRLVHLEYQGAEMLPRRPARGRFHRQGPGSGRLAGRGHRRRGAPRLRTAEPSHLRRDIRRAAEARGLWPRRRVGASFLMALISRKKRRCADRLLAGRSGHAGHLVLIFIPVTIVAMLSFTDYQFGARSFNWIGFDNYMVCW